MEPTLLLDDYVLVNKRIPGGRVSDLFASSFFLKHLCHPPVTLLSHRFNRFFISLTFLCSEINIE